MAAAAPIISLIAVGLAAVGLLGAFFGLVSPMAGFSTFVAGCLFGGVFSTVLSLIGIFLTRGNADPMDRTKALSGLAISLGLLIVILGAAAPGSDAPPINDITTDLEDPPAFASPDLVPDYQGRDMAYPAEFVEVVRASYPDLAPLEVDDPPADAFLHAVRAAESLHWEVVAKDSGAGTFYARDVTSVFRFVDDIVVRVRPNPTGSTIDVRSKSRDGQGDLGANAERIRALLAKLAA